MSDHHAFMQAILANPDEDAPRLIYADWLEEQGNYDRAEFIRVQCARVQLPPRDPLRKEFAKRERDLLFRHAEEWRNGLPPLSHLVWRFWERGCMAAVQVNQVAALCHQAEMIFSVAPVQTLIFWNIDDDTAGRLAQEPFLERIRRFTVRGGSLTWRGVRLLAESRFLASLKELRLEHQRMGDNAVETLAQSPNLAGLQSLCLVSNGITSHGFEALVVSPFLRGLTEIDLSFNNIGRAGMESLIRHKPWKQLSVLDLQSNSSSEVVSVERLGTTDKGWYDSLKSHYGDAIILDDPYIIAEFCSY
jgi:uncharacterized protein (TIGR02996 family)